MEGGPRPPFSFPPPDGDSGGCEANGTLLFFAGGRSIPELKDAQHTQSKRQRVG